MMHILADENCDRLIVATLRDAGHDVAFVVEEGRGSDDDALVLRAQKQDRIILTDDLDFGRLAEREREHSPSIVLMRMGTMSRSARVKRIVEIINGFDGPAKGQLIVVEPGQVRRRRFGSIR